MVINIKNNLDTLYKFSHKKINLFLVLLMGLSFSITDLQIFTVLFLSFLIFDRNTKNVKALKKSNFKIACFVTALLFPVLILVNILSSVLMSEFSLQESVIKLEESKIDNILVYVIGISIVTPLIEEMYFRKILLIQLCKRVGFFWALLISSFYFSIVHLNILASPTLFVLGLLLGLTFILSKSFFWPFILHAVFNLSMFSSIMLF